MPNRVYKKIEVTGTSTISIEEAVQSALKHASQSVRGLSWFEVLETRGNIIEGTVDNWQVTVKIGFALD
ncbi:hypothetical protein CA13_45820 [Planctomycetes bacterium CA13]|uniref:Dodecin n=1 Tax=Novipirellula herctigrandis TaxID=2527986 RepID=A0A5C5Z6T0_9BACT|nr:hypothetical protein CA13_45820 [Planctomycetes bacterium CA13]